MAKAKGKVPFDRTLILITSAGMGQGADELRVKLLRNYLRLLAESGPLPGAIALYTEGVRLACAGSPVLDELNQLAAARVPIILCMTCLNFYGITDAVQVGIIGGMTDIIAAQQAAEKVITL